MPKRRKKPTYRSGLEDVVIADLKARKIDFDYESKYLPYLRRVPSGICAACGHTVVHQRRRYLPDLIFPSGMLVEIKGYFKSADRAKVLAVRESNPDLDLRLLFGANNKLQKKNDKRYSDWCEEYGIKYSVGKRVPAGWLELKPESAE